MNIVILINEFKTICKRKKNHRRGIVYMYTAHANQAYICV